MEFTIPNEYEKWDRIENGVKIGKGPAISWYTNLAHNKRNQPLDLYKKYVGHEDKYPKYDELDCIRVGKTCDIPEDYNGLMGVPISFLDKYCPEQFEILDGLNRYTICDYFGVNEDVRKRHSHCTNINGKATFFAILIRHKK